MNTLVTPKPCLFCRSENVHIVTVNAGNTVECCDCGACGPWQIDRFRAVMRWNKPKRQDEFHKMSEQIFSRLDELAEKKQTGKAFDMLRREFNINPDDFIGVLNTWTNRRQQPRL